MKRQLNSLKALIAEDDKVLQFVVIKELNSVGIRTVAVSNGIDAIKAMQKEKFDFVLMDISMPEQDGLDATRWIRDLRQESSGSNIPIFAVTSFSTDEHTKEIMEAGFSEHLPKPFHLENFLKTLEKYF